MPGAHHAPGGPRMPQQGSRDGRYVRQASTPGPIGEGHGDVEVGLMPKAAQGNEPARVLQGNSKRKFLGGAIAGLVLVGALICGAGYYVYNQGQNSTPSVPADGVTGGTASTERNFDPTPTESTGGSDISAQSPTPTAVVPAEAPMVAPAPAPAPVLLSIPVNPALGKYDEPMEMPIIPVAAVVQPDGKVMSWSAHVPDNFYRGDRYVTTGGGTGETQHAVWDPATNEVTGMVVSNTGHDMFCPGITQLPSGDIIVTGGQNADKTSIFNMAAGTWAEAATMNLARGYGSSCLLSNGKVMALGGSWSGPEDSEKDAELFDPATGEWTLLPGIQAAYILTNDVEGVYRADNYGWFHPWSNGTVFHAGPSTKMHWFSTDGEGSALIAGTRPGGNSANGNCVMYDTGKILAAGGSEAFAKPQFPCTTEASLITIGAANTQATAKALSPMNLPRCYANGVVLPDGKVFITGGANEPKEFFDGGAQYHPEIWDPATEEFTMLDTEHKVARTYHSVGVLMKDARVFTGGGGLCGGCAVNHLDAEIFNPPYLYTPAGTLAPRPSITVSAPTAAHGATLTVTPTEQLMMVSMIRMGGVTHSTNTDQRRIELCGPFTLPCEVGAVNVTIPADPGISLPGNWMFFGVNADGVPSVAEVVLVGLPGDLIPCLWSADVLALGWCALIDKLIGCQRVPLYQFSSPHL